MPHHQYEVNSDEEMEKELREIEQLELRARLVVLSQCDSFKGDLRSDGVVGLTRAFVAAGAHTLVASLWKVHDEATLKLMARFYEARGVSIVHEPEQDSHDFEKCLRWLQRKHDSRETAGGSARPFSIAAYGAFGGRLDQQMANLNMLYRSEYARSFENFVLLSEDSLALLLLPGAWPAP